MPGCCQDANSLDLALHLLEQLPQRDLVWSSRIQPAQVRLDLFPKLYLLEAAYA